ncbi:MAG: hypothetical protein ACOCUS_01710, partial [Polyangiales bacterium]
TETISRPIMMLLLAIVVIAAGCKNTPRASSGEHMSLEGMATEGGSAERWSSDGEIERIRGGLLFETKRLTFDYVFDDSDLLCAIETTSNLRVLAEGSPGWESFWHRQHLVFDGGELIWSSRDSTSDDKERGRDVVDVQTFAQELLEEARASQASSDE